MRGSFLHLLLLPGTMRVRPFLEARILLRLCIAGPPSFCGFFFLSVLDEGNALLLNRASGVGMIF